MSKRRTPSQRAAVLAVRVAARKLIAEIDRYHDPRNTKFMAHFHLERWRTDRTMNPFPVECGSPLYQSASTILRQ